MSTGSSTVECSGRFVLPYVGAQAALSCACSTVTGKFLAFPLEKVVLRREALLASNASSELAGKYTGLIRGLQHIWMTEGGLRAFYRGLSFQISRSLTTTAPLLVMDEALRTETR